MVNYATAVSAIENNCIAAATKDRYASSNYQFIMWLYNHRATFPDLLRPLLVEQLNQIKEAEMAEGRKTKLMRNLIKKEWLEKMERTDPEKCPVDTTLLTYDIAASYMTQKKDGNGNFLSKQ